MKKDDYLTTMIQVPPKQRMKIAPFDQKTQREAFTVSLEGLKGWNPSALILESAQAREDRKKRKELKRLAKARAQAQAAAMSASTPTPQLPPIQAPVPQSATSSSFPRSATPNSAIPRPQNSATPRPAGASTPRPALPVTRPNSTKPILGLAPVQVPGPGTRVGTPLRTGTPTGPHPLSAPPLSASTLTSAALPPVGGMAQQQEKRGKKREREEGNGGVNGSAGLSSGNWNSSAVTPAAPIPTAVIGARAGVGNVRPRPVKKQRMDMQGQARDSVPVQQPTPQGV